MPCPQCFGNGELRLFPRMIQKRSVTGEQSQSGLYLKYSPLTSIRSLSLPFLLRDRLMIPCCTGFWPATHFCASFERKFRPDRGGLLRRIDLVSSGSAREIRVFAERLPRIVAGAIQVGHESADNEEAVQVCGFHGLHDCRCSVFRARVCKYKP